AAHTARLLRRQARRATYPHPPAAADQHDAPARGRHAGGGRARVGRAHISVVVGSLPWSPQRRYTARRRTGTQCSGGTVKRLRPRRARQTIMPLGAPRTESATQKNCPKSVTGLGRMTGYRVGKPTFSIHRSLTCLGRAAPLTAPPRPSDAALVFGWSATWSVREGTEHGTPTSLPLLVLRQDPGPSEAPDRRSKRCLHLRPMHRAPQRDSDARCAPDGRWRRDSASRANAPPWVRLVAASGGGVWWRRLIPSYPTMRDFRTPHAQPGNHGGVRLSP